MEYKTYEEIIQALKDRKKIIQKYPHNYRLTSGGIGNENTKWLQIKYYYCNPQMNRTFAVLEDGTKVDSSIDILDIAYGGFIDYIEDKNKKLVNIHWRDVFDSCKILGRDYSECRLVADSINYKYLALNGYVYSISDLDMKNPVCEVDKLL
jgi:hypothetical protein